MTFYRVPEGGYRRFDFLKRNNERVALVVFYHVDKRIEGYIACKINVRFDSPVPLVLLQQFMFEEKLDLFQNETKSMRKGVTRSLTPELYRHIFLYGVLLA